MFETAAIERNPSRADRIIKFLNCLPLIDGPAVGQRFKVDPWLESWIRDIYEPEYNDGRRVVRRAVLSVARKNAKSYAVAGLLLAHLIGPEAIPNGQVYSCATDREQASVIFKMASKMIDVTPVLQRYLKVIPSTKTISVKRSDTVARGSTYRALSAESSTKHGLGPSFFVFDEFGEARNDDLWNTMLDGQQAVASPLAVVISTQTNDPQHPLSLMIDDGLRGGDPSLVCHVHAADEDCALDDEEQWIKANPAVLTWKSIEPIRIAAAEAMRLPSKEQNFRRRYLNQRVSMHAGLIAQSEWRKLEADAPYDLEPGESIYLGLDMSATTDLTALVAVSATDGSRIKAWYWKPADLVGEHTRRDRVRYDQYAREGLLTLAPGAIIDPRLIARKIVELAGLYDVRALAYDRYRTDEVLRHFADLEFAAQSGSGDGLRLEPIGQGYVGFSPMVNAFEFAVKSGELVHDGHPLTTYCALNAMVVSDPAGNRKLDKAASRYRIDGAVALSMALGVKATDIVESAPSNPWEDESFSILSLMR